MAQEYATVDPIHVPTNLEFGGINMQSFLDSNRRPYRPVLIPQLQTHTLFGLNNVFRIRNRHRFPPHSIDQDFSREGKNSTMMTLKNKKSLQIP